MSDKHSLSLEDHQPSLAWRIGGWIGAAVYVIVTLAYMLLGRLNDDEGWYSLASRLVYSGQIPYIDFAYTQTPLFPYIYGLPQFILSPSLLLGRATSAVFSISAFAIWLVIVRKRSGVLGASLTALLLGTFSLGLYANAIVKTFAVLTLFLTLTFFLMTESRRRQYFAVLAAATALAAVLVRLSALPFAFVIIAYLLATSRPKNVKLAIGLLTTAVLVGFLFLYGQDSQAVIWNLVGYHSVAPGSGPAFLQFDLFVLPCASAVLISFLPYLALAVLCLLFSGWRTWKPDTFGRQSLVFGLGVAMYGAANFVGGSCHIDYLIPAAYVLLPMLAMGFAHAYRRQRYSIPRNAILRVALFAILISEMVRGGWQYTDLSGGLPPIYEIREIADQVRVQTSPTDRLLALEALTIAVEADRPVLPGLTMAQFSLYEGESDQARRLKLVNGDIILQYLNSGAAKVVVFTDQDWEGWRGLGISGKVEAALSDCYESPEVRDNFGQYARSVYIYIRKPDCPSTLPMDQ